MAGKQVRTGKKLQGNSVWRVSFVNTSRIASYFLPVLLILSCQFAHGTTITFEEFPADNINGTMPSTRYAYLGVTFSGIDDGTTFGGISNGNPGGWSLEGTNGPTFQGYNGASYGMTLTSNGFSSFSLDVSRSSGSASSDTFTLEGYVNSVLVESTTVPLNTVNVWSTTALTTFVDEIRWFGTGTAFHPYGVDNLNFTVIPEPSTFALAGIGLLGLAACGRRRKRRRA